MLAEREIWRFLEVTKPYRRWRQRGFGVTLPHSRLTVGDAEFSVGMWIGLYGGEWVDEEDPPLLVRTLTVTPDSAVLRRSSWYRNVVERLGRPERYDRDRRLTFVRRTPHPTRRDLRAEMDLVSAAISPPDPRFGLLSVLPLPFRLAGVSLERSVRIGQAILSAHVQDFGALFFARHRDESRPVPSGQPWAARLTTALERAGYRNESDRRMMTFLKPTPGRREIARLDALLDELARVSAGTRSASSAAPRRRRARGAR